jgi:subtilisin family serine protease
MIRPTLALVLLLAAVPAAAQHVVHLPFQAAPEGELIVPDEFIVVFDRALRGNLEALPAEAGRARANTPSVQAVLDAVGAQGFRRQFPAAVAESNPSRADLTGHYKVTLPAQGAGLSAALAVFSAHPDVDHVETIGVHPVHAVPNDTFYDNPPPEFPYDQWNYWDTYGIDADLAWDIESGSQNVVVGVLDSGVRYFHVDLGGPNALWGPDAPHSNGNIWNNPGEIPNNSTDDDGNGFVDDTIGWDFVSSGGGAGVTCLDQDCSGVDNDPDDGNGHGTHVAGTVAAMTNNARSVAGVGGGFSNGLATGSGNGIRIMPLRIGFHARYQGIVTGVVRMDWAAEAMTYVADQVDAGVNVTAVNCSWGSSDSGGLGAAVTNLLARDVLIVHSAGNSNSSTPDFLGGRDGVMNVAATNAAGPGASFSNYGSWVDLAAPGEEILSTFANPDDPDLNNHYIAILSGTSMSSPHACGVAALLESFQPGLSGPDKFALMVDNTTPYTDPRDLGSGILNAQNALNAVSPSAVGDRLFSRPRGLALRAYPNPARSGLRLVIESPSRAEAAVSVVDPEGRLVRSLGSHPLDAGINEVSWDGRNARGIPAPRGMYFLVVRTAGAAVSGKVMVLR